MQHMNATTAFAEDKSALGTFSSPSSIKSRGMTRHASKRSLRATRGRSKRGVNFDPLAFDAIVDGHGAFGPVGPADDEATAVGAAELMERPATPDDVRVMGALTHAVINSSAASPRQKHAALVEQQDAYMRRTREEALARNMARNVGVDKSARASPRLVIGSPRSSATMRSTPTAKSISPRRRLHAEQLARQLANAAPEVHEEEEEEDSESGEDSIFLPPHAGLNGRHFAAFQPGGDSVHLFDASAEHEAPGLRQQHHHRQQYPFNTADRRAAASVEAAHHMRRAMSPPMGSGARAAMRLSLQRPESPQLGPLIDSGTPLTDALAALARLSTPGSRSRPSTAHTTTGFPGAPSAGQHNLARPATAGAASRSSISSSNHRRGVPPRPSLRRRPHSAAPRGSGGDSRSGLGSASSTARQRSGFATSRPRSRSGKRGPAAGMHTSASASSFSHQRMRPGSAPGRGAGGGLGATTVRSVSSTVRGDMAFGYPVDAEATARAPLRGQAAPVRPVMHNLVGEFTKEEAAAMQDGLLYEWMQCYQREQSAFASGALGAEARLRQAQVFAAELPQPNALTAAVAFQALDEIKGLFGRFGPLMEQITSVLREATFESPPPLEPTRSRQGEDADERRERVLKGYVAAACFDA